jgi:hypothetical protein
VKLIEHGSVARNEFLGHESCLLQLARPTLFAPRRALASQFAITPHSPRELLAGFDPSPPLLRHQPTAATPVSSNFPPGSGTGTQLSG